MTYNKEKAAKWIAWGGGILICTSLFILTFNTFSNFSNVFEALMGREIAKGNILLANSYAAAGTSKYFPYAIIKNFFTLFTSHSRISHAFTMVTLNSILFIAIYYAVKILLGRKPNIFILLSFAAIFFDQSHNGNGLENNWAHIPLTSLAVICLYYKNEKFSNVTKISIIILLALLVDKYDYLYFIIPFIIENTINSAKTRKFDKRLIYVGIGLLVYYIALLLRKTLYPEYSIYVWDFYSGAFQVFTPIEKIWERLAQFYTSFSYWFSAVFFGKRMQSSIPNLIFAVIMLFTLATPFLFLKKLVKEYKETNRNTRFITFLSLSAVIMFFIPWLSQASVFHGERRYFAGFVVNSIILGCYWIDKHFKDHKGILPFVFLFVMILSFTQNSYRLREETKAYMELAKTLETERLEKGLAGLLIANPLNFYAKKTIAGNLGNETSLKSWRQGSWLTNNDIYNRVCFKTK
jgi:hypothetical protein